MPFLRAALLKKKAIQQTQQEQKQKEEEKIISASPVVSFEPVEVEEQEPQELTLTTIAELHKIIDDRAEQAEAEPEPEEEIVEEISQEPEQIFEEFEEVEEVATEETPEEFNENVLLDEAPAVVIDEEPQDLPGEQAEQEPEPEPEPEVLETSEEETVPEAETETELEPAVTLEPEKEPEEFKLQYDVTSGERYVDKVSTKTEFDKMLDELANISKDLLSWEVEKFAKEYTGKFDGSDEKKYEAFLGGYITNAAMTLYDNGYRDAAIKQLEQAKNILIARKKLEDETQAIKDRVEEEEALVDLSDILGMFGDG